MTGPVKRVNLTLIDKSTNHTCQSVSKSEQVFESNPTDRYQNYIDLVPGVYRFYWNVTKDNKNSPVDIIGEIHCKTLGWMGFGLSPNGGMNGSDIVIGWVRNGVANFTVNITKSINIIIIKVPLNVLLNYF